MRTSLADPGDPGCPGVRPGARLRYPGWDDSYGCTYGFLFRGSDGAVYASTSGFCAPFKKSEFRALPQETVWQGNTGPGAQDGSVGSDGRDKRLIGHWVYLRKPVHPDWRNFGLIRLDRGVAYSPVVCAFGGPRGMTSEITNTPTEIHFYGQGGYGRDVPGAYAQDDVLPRGMYDPNIVEATAPREGGDAGAPVLVGDKLALGLHDGITHATFGVPPAAGPSITRLTAVVPPAETALHLRLTLMKS